MARRASKKTNPAAIIGISAALLIVMIAIIMLAGGSNKSQSGTIADFPIDDYLSRGSILRDNTYRLSGRVDERMPRGSGELIVLLVKKSSGIEELLPVIVYQDNKSINIERGQEYNFNVKVISKGSTKGLLVAESVSAVR